LCDQDVLWDFLRRVRHDKVAMIDFDRNATAPLHPLARVAMTALLEDRGLGNPSSVHRPGQRARAIVEQGREAIARATGGAAGDVVLTSGGTEADALAIAGVVRGLAATGRPCGLACTAIEHPAVTGTAAALRREGREVVTIPTDREGRIHAEDLARVLREHPGIGQVSITAAHHELGNVTPIADLVRAIRDVREDIVVHTDAVQAFGKTRLSMRDAGVDLLSISAHKIGGPAGIGALLCARHVPITPLWGGGAQQAGRRPGTESAILTAGFAAAATVAAAEQGEWAARVRPLGDRLRAGLESLGAALYGDRATHLGNTALVGFAGCDGHLAMMALDLAGFACSTGAACSAGTIEASAVLRALGDDSRTARTALRFSIGAEHSEADIDALLAALPPILAAVRAASADLEVA